MPTPALNRLLAAVTLAAAGGVLAAPPEPPRHAGAMPMLGGPGLMRMLDGVGVSADQRSQIEKIAAAARADLRALHDEGRALRTQGLQLFAQPALDEAAAEALRQQLLARHDQASRRSMQAMLDIGRVLTPEQRQQLAERMQQRADGARGRGPGRGPGG